MRLKENWREFSSRNVTVMVIKKYYENVTDWLNTLSIWKKLIMYTCDICE